MNTKAVGSLSELESLVSQTTKSFLLIYKSGSDQSQCALERIRDLRSDEDITIATVDVTKVRDIHGSLGIDSAPSLVIFKNSSVINTVKGCQTMATYDSLISGRPLGSSPIREDGKKQPHVTVYTTPSCSWCTTLKTYLDQQGVNYREVDVASDTAAAEAMVKKSGQQGVPQTEIRGQMIVGFDKNKINRLLEIA
jgi:glutaredoxin-like YruB-family protein